MDTTSKARYSTPSLDFYGTLSDLTAGGSINAAEDNNNGSNGGMMDPTRLA